MNSYLKHLSILLVFIIFTSCKKEATLSEYKYADKLYFNCDGVNSDLFREALYSFEEDITKQYARNGRQNLTQAYGQAITASIYGRGKYNEMVSPHTKKIFELLKTQTNLWNTDGKIKTLNYNHDLVKCIAKNITNEDIKTTFNALLSTNSMSPKLFGEAMRRQSNLAIKDKYLATYIALDMYYAKLFDVDLNAPKTEKKQQNLNKTQISVPEKKEIIKETTTKN